MFFIHNLCTKLCSDFAKIPNLFESDKKFKIENFNFAKFRNFRLDQKQAKLYFWKTSVLHKFFCFCFLFCCLPEPSSQLTLQTFSKLPRKVFIFIHFFMMTFHNFFLFSRRRNLEKHLKRSAFYLLQVQRFLYKIRNMKWMKYKLETRNPPVRNSSPSDN